LIVPDEAERNEEEDASKGGVRRTTTRGAFATKNSSTSSVVTSTVPRHWVASRFALVARSTGLAVAAGAVAVEIGGVYAEDVVDWWAASIFHAVGAC